VAGVSGLGPGAVGAAVPPIEPAVTLPCAAPADTDWLQKGRARSARYKDGSSHGRLDLATEPLVGLML